MSKPKVWGTSVKGNVYTLDVSHSEWIQVKNQQNVLQGFKKVAASPIGAWALGCDHQVYIFVEKSDVPIRCQVSTYENERWLPTQGWNQNNLLPAVDPFAWSSEDGHVLLPKEDFKVPSRSWEWEGDWRVDQNVLGFATDKEGWRFSHLGFQSGFTHKKTFRSCVRRRKWIRYYRYKATDLWAKLASIRVDPLEEPIIDVTVGAYNLPNLEEGGSSVWIVTIDGKIVFRSGVCQKNPEGGSWVHITLADDHDIVSISAGSTDLVWSVTWHGAILARTGVTWQNLKGTDWVQVPVPEGLGDKDRIVQAAVGQTSAWVVSLEGKVWLRKGISIDHVHGTGWLKMVDTMKMTAVIGQDKVIGVDLAERQMYFRLGIGSDEQSGRSWQLMDLPYTIVNKPHSVSLSSEVSSLTDENSSIIGDGDLITFHRRTSESTEDSIEKSISVLSVNENESETEICGEKSINAPPIKHKYSNDQKVQATEAEIKSYNSNEKSKVGQPITGYSSRTEQSSSGNDIKTVVDRINNASAGQNDEEICHTKEISRQTSSLSGGATHISECDSFLAMGLNNDFDGLELNLEIDEEQEIRDTRTFGHLAIDMEQVVSQGDSSSDAVEVSGNNSGNKTTDDWLTEGAMDNPSIVWDGNVGGKEDSAMKNNEPKSKFVSFNRFRTNFGNKLQSPVKVINKLKTANPKKMLKDLHDDLQDSKKEVFHVISQAQQVFRHGKPENSDADNIKVSFKKESGESENMELKFYEVAKADEIGLKDAERRNNGVTDGQQRYDSTIDLGSTLSVNNLPTSTFSMQTIGGALDEETSGHITMPWRGAEQDRGEIQWSWVSGCFTQDYLEDAKLKHWFYNDKDSALKMVYQNQVSKSCWRDIILKDMRDLAGKVNKFKYQHAIENTSWCKTGTMKWWQDVHRSQKWLNSRVELSQDEKKACSSLTIHYTWKSKQQHVFLDLKDVVCIRCEKEQSAHSHTFCIYTTDRQTAVPPKYPVRLSVEQEQTMEDWVSTLCLTVGEVRATLGKPHPQSMWSLTDRSDVFVHEPATQASIHTSTLFWRNFGGHLSRVESNCLGITWGIANNGTVYVYSGGYGGGFFKGVASSPYGIHAMVDTHSLYIYENQRWRLGKGYTDKAKLVRHYMWSDETGRKELTKDSVKLASCHSSWLTDWAIDYKTPGGVDKEGWQYASGKSFYKKFYPRPKINSSLRRRRWCRKYKVITTGPWDQVQPLKLVDVSVQPDPFQTGLDQPVAVWAVGVSGEMLCREGVTVNNFKGTGWVHVTSDQIFTSVSIAMDLVVWAVSQDGGVWRRHGVNPNNIAGGSWLHISPPLHTHLIKVSAGASGVWSVDDAGHLWCRTGITLHQPSGNDWVKVRSNVRQVSAGLLDQIWAIIDESEASVGPVNGVLAKYTKTSSDESTMGTWEAGIGGGWKYICARGQMI